MRLPRLIAAVACLLLFAGFARAEEEKSYWRWYADDTYGFIKATGDSPFWQTVVLMAGATAITYQYDISIGSKVSGSKSDFSESAACVGEVMGNGMYVAPALGAGWLFGYWIEDKKFETASKLALEGFVLTGVAANAVKYVAHRHRPKEGDGATRWDTLDWSSTDDSFPSGHATTAWSWATIFATVYEDTAWVPILAYSAATTASLSRIYTNDHWASDVVFGSLFGYVTSKALVEAHKSGLGISFMPGPGGNSVIVSKAF